MLLLPSATEDFLAHCKIEKNLSPKTIKAYQTDLLQFQAFLRSIDCLNNLSLITKVQLRSFIDSISNLKPKSIKRKIASVKAFFNYLEFEDQLKINPFRKMRISIKEPKKLPTVMNINEVSQLFRAAYSDKDSILNQSSYSYQKMLTRIAVIELLFATGGRVSEIANLKPKAVNLDTGIIAITGKGNKERIIQICNPDSITILKLYFEHYKSTITKENCFLINRKNKKLSDQSIRIIVKNLAQVAGLSTPITPHVFRHSFATLLLEQDVDIKYIQSMLGHSSINTTQIYTHVNREKQRQILLDKHPRKDINMMAG